MANINFSRALVNCRRRSPHPEVRAYINMTYLSGAAPVNRKTTAVIYIIPRDAREEWLTLLAAHTAPSCGVCVNLNWCERVCVSIKICLHQASIWCVFSETLTHVALFIFNLALTSRVEGVARALICMRRVWASPGMTETQWAEVRIWGRSRCVHTQFLVRRLTRRSAESSYESTRAHIKNETLF